MDLIEIEEPEKVYSFRELERGCLFKVPSIPECIFIKINGTEGMSIRHNSREYSITERSFVHFNGREVHTIVKPVTSFTVTF